MEQVGLEQLCRIPAAQMTPSQRATIEKLAGELGLDTSLDAQTLCRNVYLFHHLQELPSGVLSSVLQYAGPSGVALSKQLEHYRTTILPPAEQPEKILIESGKKRCPQSVAKKDPKNCDRILPGYNPVSRLFPISKQAFSRPERGETTSEYMQTHMQDVGYACACLVIRYPIIYPEREQNKELGTATVYIAKRYTNPRGYFTVEELWRLLDRFWNSKFTDTEKQELRSLAAEPDFCYYTQQALDSFTPQIRICPGEKVFAEALESMTRADFTSLVTARDTSFPNNDFYISPTKEVSWVQMRPGITEKSHLLVAQSFDYQHGSTTWHLFDAGHKTI